MLGQAEYVRDDITKLAGLLLDLCLRKGVQRHYWSRTLLPFKLFILSIHGDILKSCIDSLGIEARCKVHDEMVMTF